METKTLHCSVKVEGFTVLPHPCLMVVLLYYSSEKYDKHRVYVNGDGWFDVDGYCLNLKTNTEALDIYNKLRNKELITACELINMGFLTYQQLNQKEG